MTSQTTKRRINYRQLKMIDSHRTTTNLRFKGPSYHSSSSLLLVELLDNPFCQRYRYRMIQQRWM